MLSIRNPDAPKPPKPPRDSELPWVRLYYYITDDWETPDDDDLEDSYELENFDAVFAEYPVLPKAPLSLELLISTATALRPMFGVSAKTETEDGVEITNGLVVQEAYDLLLRCGELWGQAEYREQKRMELEKRQLARRERGQQKHIKFTEAVLAITGYAGPGDAKHYFKVFLEVFYGEVVAVDDEEMREPDACMPCRWVAEAGNYRQWAAVTCESYKARGFWEDEVTFFTERFKKLTEGGFLEKSTSRPLSRARAKKRKTKG
jgi:hypothetical protein